MAFNGLIIKTSTTAASFAGGTDITFASDGKYVANGMHVTSVPSAGFLLTRNLTASTRRPTLQGNGAYSKRIGSFSLVVPLDLAGEGQPSNIVYPVVRASVEISPLMSSAQIIEVRRLGAQVLLAESLDGFFNNSAVV